MRSYLAIEGSVTLVMVPTTEIIIEAVKIKPHAIATTLIFIL